MKITLLDDYQNVVKDIKSFQLLKEHDVQIIHQPDLEHHVLVEKLKDTEVLVLIRERTKITESLLAVLPNLRLISQTGKVSHHIDPVLCRKYGVDVAEGIGSPIAPSELCWALIMAASRQIPNYMAHFSNGKWQQSGHPKLGRTLHGLTLGIWGYGKIGQRIAQYANAFGMRVIVWGSRRSRNQACSDGFTAADSKECFFHEADIVSLHLRLNDATRHIVKREDLAAMKSDSLFVNVSRSELVEPDALYLEISANPNKQAALDVYDREPANIDNEPLLTLPNVTCTPHLGYVENNSYELYFDSAFKNVVAFASGQPQNLVRID